MSESAKIRIKLLGYDHKLIDQAMVDIVDRANRTGSKVVGPVPLPTTINRYTVLRSPHVDKKSREQFEIRTHRRMLEIVAPKQETIVALSRLDLASGVIVRIKDFKKK